MAHKEPISANFNLKQWRGCNKGAKKGLVSHLYFVVVIIFPREQDRIVKTFTTAVILNDDMINLVFIEITV